MSTWGGEWEGARGTLGRGSLALPIVPRAALGSPLYKNHTAIPISQSGALSTVLTSCDIKPLTSLLNRRLITQFFNPHEIAWPAQLGRHIRLAWPRQGYFHDNTQLESAKQLYLPTNCISRWELTDFQKFSRNSDDFFHILLTLNLFLVLIVPIPHSFFSANFKIFPLFNPSVFLKINSGLVKKKSDEIKHNKIK